MTAKNPDITKRASRVEAGGAPRPDETGAAEGERQKTPEHEADRSSGSDAVETEDRPAPVSDGAGEGARSNGGPDGGPQDGRAPVLEEILGVVKVIEQRTRQPKGGTAGPTKAAVDELAKSVEELGAKGGVKRALRKQLGRINRDSKGAIEAAAKLTRELRTYRRDLARWIEENRRIRRRWAGLALAAGFPAALLLGVLVEQQFQVIPLHDPTGGWRGHVWDNYGRKIVDCATEAMQTDAEVNCPLVVRRP